MLSKLIYRFLAVALLALVTQVGISQNYVDAAEASEILTDAIEELQTEIDNGPNYTGSFQSSSTNTATVNNKIDLQIMKIVRDDIQSQDDVKSVMDVWYEKAESEISERKTKLILALDKVKDLLS